MLIDGSEGNFNRIFHPVAKTEMPGQVNLQRTEIQQRWTKVFLHFVLLFSPVLNGIDQRTSINSGNIKCFHLVMRDIHFQPGLVSVRYDLTHRGRDVAIDAGRAAKIQSCSH